MILIKIKEIYYLKLQNLRKRQSQKKIEKKQKIDALEIINALYESIELVLNAFKSIIFANKSIESTGGPDMLSLRVLHLSTRLKISTSKHMIQRLSVALAHLKAGNTFENAHY